MDFGKAIAIGVLATIIFVIANQVIIGSGSDITVDLSNFDAQPIFKYLVVGVVIFLSYALVQKYQSKSFSAKDVFGLVILGIAAYFVWTYVLGPQVFNAAAYKLQSLVP